MKHDEHPGAGTFSILRTRPVAWICGAILWTFAFTFSGCVSRPALNVQTFAFTASTLPSRIGSSNSAILEIRTLQVTPPFNGRSLIYRTGESDYQCDPYAEFLAPPAEGLPGPVSEMLRGDGFNVVQPGSAVRPDIIAEISITQLYGDIREPESPYAVLVMEVTFLDATNGLPGKLLFQKNYSGRVGMSSTTPAALMAGWTQALERIMAEATYDLRAAKEPLQRPIQ
jgi:cholesterol transport system auxiliary component